MKRYHSAFAAPSGFVVSSSVKAAKSARRGDGAVRLTEVNAAAPVPAKPRLARDVRDRAA